MHGLPVLSGMRARQSESNQKFKILFLALSLPFIDSIGAEINHCWIISSKMLVNWINRRERKKKPNQRMIFLKGSGVARERSALPILGVYKLSVERDEG